MKRRLRQLAAGLGVALLAVVVLLAGGYAWVRSPAGLGWVAGQLSTAFDSETLDIEIATLSGDPFGEMTLGGLRIADRGGVWLTAPRLHLDWSPLDLLTDNRLSLHAVEGDPVALARLPEGSGKAEAGPLLPALPFAMAVERLALDIRYRDAAYTLGAEGLALGTDRLGGILDLATSQDGDRLAVTIEESGDGPVKIDGVLTIAPGGLLADLTGLSLDATETAQLAASLDGFRGGAGVLSLALKGSRIGIELDGPFDLSGRPLLDAAAFTLLLPGYESDAFKVTEPDVTGTLTLSRDRVDLAYKARAQQVQAANVRLSDPAVDGTLSYAGGLAKGSLAVEESEIAIGGEQIVLRQLAADWQADTASGDWAVAVTRLSSDWVETSDLRAYGRGGRFTRADGRLTALPAALGALSGGEIVQGQLSLLIETGGMAEDGTLALEVRGEGEAFAYQSDQLSALLGRAPGVTVSATRDTSGIFRIGKASLAGALIETDAEGSLDPVAGGTEIIGTLHLADLKPLAGEAADLPGGLSVSYALSGPLDALAASAESRLDTFEGYGIALAEIAAKADLAKTEAGWQGDITLRAVSELGPVVLASPLVVKPDGGGISFPDIAFTSPIATASGHADLPAGKSPEAVLRLHLPEKSRHVDGVAEIDVTYRGEGLHATLKAERLRVRLPGRFPYRLREAEGSLDLRMDEGAPVYKGSLTAEGFAAGAQRIGKFILNADSAAEMPVTVEAQGNWQQAFNLTLGVRPAEKAFAASLEGRIGDMRIGTDEPIRLGLAEGWQIDIPGLSLGGGKLTASVSQAPGGLPGGEIALQGIGADILDLLAPGLVANGTLDGRLRFGEAEDGPGGTAALTLSDVSFLTGSELAPADTYELTLAADAANGMLAVNGTIRNGDSEEGHLEASLPYRQDGGSVRLEEDGAVSGRLDWQGDVAPLWAMLRQTDHRLSGAVEGRLTLAGTVGAPVFEGNVRLTDGRYEHERLGLRAEISLAEVTGNRERIELSRLEATDGSKGTLEGSGAFRLTPDLSFPGRLELSLKDFEVTRLDNVQATASADLAYERTQGQGKLAGTVRTGPVTVKLPRELPASVVEIDVTEIHGDMAPAAAEAEAPLAARPTLFELDIVIDNRFKVSGRGIESEWTGKLRLGGSSADPRITGQMRLKGGTFIFASKRFDLSDGRLTFAGRRGIDPDLQVRARQPAPGFTAEILIGGRASAPTFTLSSTPALPEDEILSRILFGRSVSEVSALQLAEIALAAEGLRSGRSTGFTGKIGRTIGLDTLAVTSGGETGDETLITGGKYLTDDIYLEVETSPSTNETTTRLKVSLTDRLLVESETNEEAGNRLRLKWFWEY